MIIAYLIAVLVLIIDQITKLVAMKCLSEGENDYLIDGFLYFTKTFNPGAGWSMLEDHTWVLALISLIASGAIIYLIYKYVKNTKKDLMLSISSGLILGGTVGNLIDRWLTVFKVRKGVVDFVGMWIGNYEWPIYNVADICLVIGIILFAIWGIFLYDSKNVVINNTNEGDDVDDKEIHS